jgi:hypothetical protein
MKVRSDASNVGNQNVERLLTYVNGQLGADRVGAMVHVPPRLKTFLCGSVTREEIACALQLALFDLYLARSSFGFLPTQRAIGKRKRIRLSLIEVESLTAPIDGNEAEYGQLFWRFLSAAGFCLNGDVVPDASKSLSAQYHFIWTQQCFASFMVNFRASGARSDTTGRKAGDDFARREPPCAGIYEACLTRLHKRGVLPIEDAEYLLYAALGLLDSSPNATFSAGGGDQPWVGRATRATSGYEITNVVGDIMDAHVLDNQDNSLDEFISLSSSTHAWTPRGDCHKLDKNLKTVF